MQHVHYNVVKNVLRKHSIVFNPEKCLKVDSCKDITVLV